MTVPTFSMRQLLEAGVHFGHQTHRWNPKMDPFLFGVRNGIHIIDLQQTGDLQPVKRASVGLASLTINACMGSDTPTRDESDGITRGKVLEPPGGGIDTAGRPANPSGFKNSVPSGPSWIGDAGIDRTGAYSKDCAVKTP